MTPCYDASHFGGVFTESRCQLLRDQGWLVVDDFLTPAWAGHLRGELTGLVTAQHFKPNKTQFATPSGPVQFAKPGIFECDLHDEAARAGLQEFGALFDEHDMVGSLSRWLPELGLVAGPRGQTIKLQQNLGRGACFPLHYDNPGRPNKRSLTCLVYLNPAWKAGDGGELQLVPFLQAPVTIEPVMNRLVVFYSDRVLHRVLPNHAERLCFTVWIDGTAVNSDDDVFLKAKHLRMDTALAQRHLVKSPLQRVLSRSVYAEAYEASLRECMAGRDAEAAKGCMYMLAAHRQRLRALGGNAALSAFVERLRVVSQISNEKANFIGEDAAAAATKEADEEVQEEEKEEEEEEEAARCSACGARASSAMPLKICSGCGEAAYCSRACQVEAWKGGHKKVCKERRRAKEQSSSSRQPG